MSIPFYSPAPAPRDVFKGQPIPYGGANLLSKFTMSWIAPIMKVAWSRTIQEGDLWEVTPDLKSANLGKQLESNFMKRMPPSRRPAGYRPRTKDHADSSSSLPANTTNDHSTNVKLFGKRKAQKIQEDQLAVEDGKLYDMSLLKAAIITLWPRILVPLTAMVVVAILRTTAPLMTKMFLNQLSLSYTWHQAINAAVSTNDLTPPKSLGYICGIALALWAMTTTAAVTLYFVFWYEDFLGESLRVGAISLISKKSMRLSGKARLSMTNGYLTTLISVDASFLQKAAYALVELFALSFQLLLAMGLLIHLLGVSALVGLGVMVCTIPYQSWTFRRTSSLRKKQNRVVDGRVRLLSEVLNNIRAVKLYAYESLFIKKVSDLRHDELSQLRKNNITSATMNSVMSFLPTLAAVLTFITYSLLGHELDAATVFAALQYFNVLRGPIISISLVTTGLSDAYVGLGRIGVLLKSEELETDMRIDESSPHAIDATGDFQFESHQSVNDQNCQKTPNQPGNAIETVMEKQPFALKDLSLQVPRGSLVCIVGRVGTGKSALLSGLIQEMKQTKGHVVFGGSVSYVPQQAWVQSGTIKDNVTFSAEPADVDADRIDEIINACCLREDVDRLPDGILTAIGERGITLSGGQRQRICLARAAYQKSEIVLLDDPLSAVDAHVGHHLLQKCILNGPMADRTRILVTHHLDVLPEADLILVMERDEEGNGRIVQQGSYHELFAHEGVFKTLIKQYGSVQKSHTGTGKVNIDQSPDETDVVTVDSAETEVRTEKNQAAQLVLEEERAEGAVSLAVYIKYAQSIGGWTLPIICAMLLILTQAATVFTTLFLGFWSDGQFRLSQGAYMAIYASLGVAMAIFGLAATSGIFLAGIKASGNMFQRAWLGVMRSPTTWHDRTPTGRIISRLSKDIEMLDDRLARVCNAVLTGALGIIGTVGLVFYVYPYAGLFFIPILAYDYMTVCYYRRTSRDIKRLTSIVRSHIFTHFGEQVAGLPVIRAYHQQDNFQKRLERAVDVELAAILSGTITQGRWLGVRITFASYLLVLVVAAFGVGFRNTVPPSKLGVVLTYMISATSTINAIVGQVTEAEQQMNTVERVQYYTELPTEEAARLPSDPNSKEEWPTRGAMSFKNVSIRYRPDLPLVLKGVTFTVRSGEKIGVIGRTGAGKSTLAQALFRTVELCDGHIDVDGRDLKTLGLDTLRERLSIIPQDAFLFGGSVRDNIDPTGTLPDARLNDALRLIHDNPLASEGLREKFRLDVIVENEGANFSAGERQLLAVVRAMVRDCKVLLLDEATSSVDPKTDALIQGIIQTEFADVTLISIAHRLQTVAHYDRILGMDAGEVVEFDSPLALFDNPDSLFRGLCEKKGLSREDIVRIREEATVARLRR